MNARRKRAPKRTAAATDTAIPDADPQAVPSRRYPLNAASAGNALDACIGAISMVEVTLRSLESQEIAPSEQDVLRRALKPIWFVHDWIYELRLDDGEDSE